MKIFGIQKESFIDYPGKNSLVIFMPGCNFRCPGCHAKEIVGGKNEISEEEVLDYIDSREGWIDAAVLCGGEPSLQKDIIQFAGLLKKRKIAVKLDTNGSRSGIMKELLERGLVDYVAMDIKAPGELYSNVAGAEIDLGIVEEGIKMACLFPDYEYRTTIVPVVRKGGSMGFLTVDEVVGIAKWIIKVTGRDDHKYILQGFVPRRGGLIDKKLEKCTKTPESLVKDIQRAVKRYMPKCTIRGYS